jgi:hypothetical protein
MHIIDPVCQSQQEIAQLQSFTPKQIINKLIADPSMVAYSVCRVAAQHNTQEVYFATSSTSEAETDRVLKIKYGNN